VFLWAGFTYGLSPEVVGDTVEMARVLGETELSEMLRSHPDLDVVIAVGWRGAYQVPFVLRAYSPTFEETRMADALEACLAPCLLE